MGIAAFLIIAFASQASAGKFKTNPNKSVIYINVISAMSNPGLSEAIQSQVDHSLLNSNQPVYVAEVAYKNKIYKVSGTYEQWAWFFAPGIENLRKKRVELRLD